jgi:hypothetical protein
LIPYPEVRRQGVLSEQSDALMLVAFLRLKAPPSTLSDNKDMATRSYFKQVSVNWLFDFHPKAKLLLNLTRQALRRRFTKFDLAARKLPLVSLVLKQHDSPIRRG